MRVAEMYEIIGEDYDEVFERLGNDAWIVRYLRKFVTENYNGLLNDAVMSKNWDEGFKLSHTMKGLALNLGLSGIRDTSSALCEAMRNGEPKNDIMPMLEAENAAYAKVADAIAELD